MWLLQQPLFVQNSEEGNKCSMDNKYEIPKGSLISYFSNLVKTNGGINLAQGIPGYSPPDELLHILSETANDRTIHQYAPGIGNYKLLDRLIELYGQEINITQDNLLIVQGATEAISLLYLYLRKKHDKFAVLGFEPVYETYNNLPDIYQDTFIPFAFEKDYSIDFEKLENTIAKNKVNLIFINSPGNPLGRIFSKEECHKIIELSEKYSVYLIFDAVYRKIYYEQEPYLPLDRLSPFIFYVNSFSKLLSITGWRVGYLISHESHMQSIRAIHDYIGLCVPSVLQIAIERYLDENNFGRPYIETIRTRIKDSFKLLKSTLLELNFKIPTIDGGYFIWAQLPEQYTDGFRFAIELYNQEKVAVIPGIQFSENAQNFIRFNVAREEKEIRNGILGINTFIKS